VYQKEEEIRALGEESNFFDRENAEIELGEHIKTYRYGLQTFVERHKNGFVIYHLGNYSRLKGKKQPDVNIIKGKLYCNKCADKHWND